MDTNLILAGIKDYPEKGLGLNMFNTSLALYRNTYTLFMYITYCTMNPYVSDWCNNTTIKPIAEGGQPAWSLEMCRMRVAE